MCGAKAKRTGKPCQLYPCKNGRCHLHGGRSTGPKTPAGIKRIKQANTIHGYYSKEANSLKVVSQNLLKEYKH